MTYDECAALVERIAIIISDAPFPSKRSLAKAERILAAIEPAIRDDEREACIRALEPGEGTIGGDGVDWVMGRAYERGVNIAAIRARGDTT